MLVQCLFFLVYWLKESFKKIFENVRCFISKDFCANFHIDSFRLNECNHISGIENEGKEAFVKSLIV